MDPYFFENRLRKEGYRQIMGLDEVGRGCLAGPVVAAGVILDPGLRIEGIADSKKLSAARRKTLAREIKDGSVFWTIALCDRQEVDTWNILQASLKAMMRCVEKSDPPPDYLLVDGNHGLPSTLIPSMTIVGGDARSASIGAASILAKVFRDDLMTTLHEEFPEFGWDRNVGYPTVAHYKALMEFGATPHHRRSFRLRTDRIYRHRSDVTRPGKQDHE